MPGASRVYVGTSVPTVAAISTTGPSVLSPGAGGKHGGSCCRHLDHRTLRAFLRRRGKSLWAEVVHGNARPLLLLRVGRLEVVVEVAPERRCPGEAPTHPALECLELRDRRARDGSEGDVVVGQVDDGAVEAVR